MSRSNSSDTWKEETGPEGRKPAKDALVCNTRREPEGHSFAQAQFKPRCLVGADKLRPGTSQFPQDQARCHHIDPLGTVRHAAPLPPSHINRQESWLPKSDGPKREKMINSRTNSLIFRLSGKILVVSQAGHIRSSVAHGVIRLQTISELQLLNLGFKKT